MKRIAVLLLILSVPCADLFSEQISKKFYVGIEMPSEIPISDSVKNAVKDMGINYINFHPFVYCEGKSLKADQVIKDMQDFCNELNLSYAIGTQNYDPDFEILKKVTDDIKKQNQSLFLGVVHDELVHYKILNKYAPEVSIDNNRCSDIFQAYDNTIDKLKEVKKTFKDSGVDSVMVSHIWPVLQHAVASAGFTVCPKICKETYSPVSLAIAMGAAIQYGSDLWADCDLWFYGAVPGHSPEEVRSNLIFAYWMGVDGIFIEGAGHNLYPSGKQGMPFSLVAYIDPEHYQLTPHGEVLRWFNKEYIIKNKRRWTFRDVKPDAAIIRFEDTCHGQAYTPHFKDALYGNPDWKSDPNTEAWLGLWNVLTHGVTGSDGLTYFKGTKCVSVGNRPYGGSLVLSENSAPDDCARHTFFVPLKGVVCFDHLVDYDKIKDIPVLYLTGLKISEQTMKAVKKCVHDGTTCFIWGPLAKQNGFDWDQGVKYFSDGKGRFIAVDDFQSREIFDDIKNLIGSYNQISYRFNDSRLIINKIDQNRISVDVVKE